MKKFIFASFCLLAFGVMFYNISNTKLPTAENETNKYYESYNSEENMALAREIGKEKNIKEVTVIKDKDAVLVGISLNKRAKNKEEIKKKAAEIIKEKYPKAKVNLEVENSKSSEISEIATSFEKGSGGKNLQNKIERLFAQ